MTNPNRIATRASKNPELEMCNPGTPDLIVQQSTCLVAFQANQLLANRASRG